MRPRPSALWMVVNRPPCDEESPWGEAKVQGSIGFQPVFCSDRAMPLRQSVVREILYYQVSAYGVKTLG